ncbi:Innexin [Aphelenchoides bicaudatus]|nr:Innexin [Aphelenchoides bicaudatus]
MKQFFGDPIGCFVPPEFTGNWRKYTIDYCFARNTYFVEMEERFPPREERLARELHYYQYVPFILAVQLFMFLLPKVLCKSMNSKTGLVLNKVTAHDKLGKKDIDEKGEKLLKTLLSQYHGMPNRSLDTTAQFIAFLQKTSITRTYLLFKLLNTLNAMIQLYLINRFMAPRTTTGTGLWGYDFVHDWMDSHSWRRTGHFPRVTFCDVWTREIAAEPIVYTVQCVLMVNLLNEKIFIVVWFWLLIMSVLNAFNLFYWLFNTQVGSRKLNFIKQKLHFENKKDKNVKHIEEFVFKFLLSDGVTSLRLVEINSGGVASSLMTQLIWRKFLIERGYEKEEKPKLPEIVPNADTLKVVNEITKHFKLT